MPKQIIEEDPVEDFLIEMLTNKPGKNKTNKLLKQLAVDMEI